MNIFPHPPWNATRDETSVADSAGFTDCEQAIEAFASRGKGNITDRHCSVSKDWGRILRAKVAFAHPGFDATVLVTCWTGEGPGVRVAVEVERCGPQQAGC